LLDLEWAGQGYHLADRTVSAPFGDDGADRLYAAGLDMGGTVEDSISLFVTGAQSRAVSMSINLSGLVNVPERIEQGHDLAAARGRLWLWPEGTADRILLVDGLVVDPSYGSENDPVALTIREAAFDDRALIPGADRRVVYGESGAAGVTWLSSSPAGAPRESVENERYPIIIGHPGAGEVWAAPVLSIRSDRWVIAGHHVQAASVDIRNEDDGTESKFLIDSRSDQLGNPIATIDPTSPASGSGWSGDEYKSDAFFARWRAASTTTVDWGDGLPSPFSPYATDEGLRGAGDVLRYLLQLSTIRHDAGRLAAIAPALNAYKIDTAITATPQRRISPWAWLADQLVPLLPISARTGPDGLYFALWRFDPTHNDAALALERGRNAERRGGVSYDGVDAVANSIRVDYAPALDTDRPGASVLITGDPTERDHDPDGHTTYPARLSFSRYGRREREISAPIVCERATALQIGTWIAAAHCAPSRVVEYVIRADLAALEPGDVVSLTDDEIALADRLAHVDSIAWAASGQIGVTLRIFEGLPTLRS